MNEREIWYQGLEANGADILGWLEASNRLTLMRWTHRLRHRLESFQPSSPLHDRQHLEAELFDGADEWHEWVRVNSHPVGWARAAMDFWRDTGYLDDAKLSVSQEAAIQKALRFETPKYSTWHWHDPFWAMRLDKANADLPDFLYQATRAVWDFHKRFEVFDYFLEQNEWNEEVRVSKQQCSAALRDEVLLGKVRAVCEGYKGKASNDNDESPEDQRVLVTGKQLERMYGYPSSDGDVARQWKKKGLISPVEGEKGPNGCNMFHRTEALKSLSKKLGRPADVTKA